MSKWPLKPRIPRINFKDPLAKGLVSHWPMRERGNTTVKDIINNRNGTLSGDYSWVVDMIGNTVAFAGSTGTLNIPYDAIHDSPTGAIVFFFRSTQSSGFVALASKANASQSNGGFNIFFSGSNGFITVQTKTTGATQVLSIDGTQAYNDGKMHMVVHNWNQANGSLNTLYVDGKLEASGNVSAAWTFNSNSIRQGSANDGFWTKLNGRIGTLSWYNRNLTVSEIQRLYQNPFCFYRRSLITRLHKGPNAFVTI